MLSASYHVFFTCLLHVSFGCELRGQAGSGHTGDAELRPKPGTIAVKATGCCSWSSGQHNGQVNSHQRLVQPISNTG